MCYLVLSVFFLLSHDFYVFLLKAAGHFSLFLTLSENEDVLNHCLGMFWCRFWLAFKLSQTSIHKKSKQYVKLDSCIPGFYVPEMTFILCKFTLNTVHSPGILMLVMSVGTSY